MARNLLRAGLQLTVHNRTREREEPLAALGTKRADSPAAAARDVEVVVVVVSDTPDVEAVLFGDEGVASGARPGCVVVDMSTISPDATREFGERLASSGVGFVDAPVSGGPEGAEQGTLTIMAGGSPDDFGRVRPLLETLGSTVTHVGPLGSGQATKAVNQVIVGGMYLSVAEGMVLAMKEGLDMDAVLRAIGAGACRSWVLENRSRNMIEDRYPLGFKLRLHRKDLAIAIALATAAGAPTPLSAMVAELEDGLMEAGHGDADVSVIAKELRRRAGL